MTSDYTLKIMLIFFTKKFEISQKSVLHIKLQLFWKPDVLVKFGLRHRFQNSKVKENILCLIQNNLKKYFCKLVLFNGSMYDLISILVYRNIMKDSLSSFPSPSCLSRFYCSSLHHRHRNYYYYHTTSLFPRLIWFETFV